MDPTEIARLQQYFRNRLGMEAVTIKRREKKDDSVEVYLRDEFIGVIFRDDEDDDLCFQFNMAILEEDLPDLAQ